MKKLVSFSITFCVYSCISFSQINHEVMLKGGFQRSLATIDGSGFTYGLGVRSRLFNFISLDLQLARGRVNGLSGQAWTHSLQGGGLVEPVYEVYKNQDAWFPSYQFTSTALDVGLLLHPITLLYSDDKNRHWKPYLKGAVGLVHKRTKLDLLDQNDLPYADLLKKVPFQAFPTADGRKTIRKTLESIYDGKYETSFPLINSTSLQYSYGGGLSYQLSKKISIAFEYTVTYFPGFRYMDGILFRTALDQAKGTDKLVNGSFCIGYKL